MILIYDPVDFYAVYADLHFADKLLEHLFLLRYGRLVEEGFVMACEILKLFKVYNSIKA